MLHKNKLIFIKQFIIVYSLSNRLRVRFLIVDFLRLLFLELSSLSFYCSSIIPTSEGENNAPLNIGLIKPYQKF